MEVNKVVHFLKSTVARWTPWSWQLHPGSTLSLLVLSASQEVNTTFPLTYRAGAAEGGEHAGVQS